MPGSPFNATMPTVVWTTTRDWDLGENFDQSGCSFDSEPAQCSTRPLHWVKWREKDQQPKMSPHRLFVLILRSAYAIRRWSG